MDRILVDGLIFSLVSSVLLIVSLRVNPRMWLHDYPQEIQDMVPPKSDREKRQSLVWGIPFLILVFLGPFVSTLFLEAQAEEGATFLALFANAFGVGLMFNLVDWLLLDWLMFCAITPRFLVIPGTEGAQGYKNYAYHFRGFLIGTVITAVGALIVAGLVWML